MADSFIEVAPDSTGKKLQTFENTISANDVHAEAVVLVDQFGVPLVTIPVSGGLTDAELRASPVDVIGTAGIDGDILKVFCTDLSGSGSIFSAGINSRTRDADNNAIGSTEEAGLIFRLWTETRIPDGYDATEGITTGAAVITDAAGTLQQYLRGLVKLWASGPPLTDAQLRATPVPVSGTVATGGLTDAQLRATAVPVSGSFSLPTGAATEAKQDTQITDLGGVTETAPASDTASSGLNGRLQRIAQRITSFIALLPASLGQKTKAGSLSVTLSSDEDIIDVELGASSINILASEITLAAMSTKIGAATETAPATDTASSGLNGRLQRIAQRITSFIALLPASLGQKTKANSFAVTFASDSDTLPVVGTKPITSTNSPTLLQNLGANATLNVKASAGNVFSLTCYNANAAARYLQLHNTATVPAGSAVPVFSFLVPPSGQIIIGTDFFTNEGCNFATGIAFAFSTARNIYTAATAGDQSTWIQYK